MSFADYFAMADFNQDGSVQLDEWMVVTEPVVFIAGNFNS